VRRKSCAKRGGNCIHLRLSPLGNEFNRLQTFASLQFIAVLRYSRWHLRRFTEIYVFERASPVILFQLPSDNSIAPIHIIFVIAMGIIGFPFSLPV